MSGGGAEGVPDRTFRFGSQDHGPEKAHSLVPSPVVSRAVIGCATAWRGLALALPISLLDDGRGAHREPKEPGKIYTTVELIDADMEKRTTSLIAIDPETGDWTKILDHCRIRPRISPDGRTVAFVKDDALWTPPHHGGRDPGPSSPWMAKRAASPPVWSGDGQQIIVSLGTIGDAHQRSGLQVLADQRRWLGETGVEASRRTTASRTGPPTASGS